MLTIGSGRNAPAEVADQPLDRRRRPADDGLARRVDDQEIDPRSAFERVADRLGRSTATIPAPQSTGSPAASPQARRAASQGPASSVRKSGEASSRAEHLVALGPGPRARTGPPTRPGCSRSPRRARRRTIASRSLTIVPSATWPRIGARWSANLGRVARSSTAPGRAGSARRAVLGVLRPEDLGPAGPRARGPSPRTGCRCRGRRTRPSRPARAAAGLNDTPIVSRPTPVLSVATRRRAAASRSRSVVRRCRPRSPGRVAARGRSAVRAHQRRASASIGIAAGHVASDSSASIPRSRPATVVGLDREQGRRPRAERLPPLDGGQRRLRSGVLFEDDMDARCRRPPRR